MNLGRENEVTEFKKSTGELEEALVDICAILNKHNRGVLYFGVKNNGDVVGQVIGEKTCSDISRKIYEKIKPTPTITIEEINFNPNPYIKVIFSGSDVPYSVNEQYFFRVSEESRKMNRSQLKEMFTVLAYSERNWEEIKTIYSPENIEEQILKKAFLDGVDKGRLTGKYTSKEAIMNKFNLMKDGFLSNAGFYLFSNLKPIKCKMAVFASEEKITFLDLKLFEGNIYECIDDGMLYISNHINWKPTISEKTRVDVPELPLNAIKEILVNSFVHARYSNITSYHEINIYPSKVTIFNPGNLPLNLDPLVFAKGHETSIFRNPTIADILYKTNRIEAFGTGYSRAFDLCDKAGIGYEYKNTITGFEFSFKRTLLPTSIKDSVGLRFNKTEKMVYDYLKVEPYVTAEELSTKIVPSKRSIERAFSSLQQKGLIYREGSKKDGYWKVIK